MKAHKVIFLLFLFANLSCEKNKKNETQRIVDAMNVIDGTTTYVPNLLFEPPKPISTDFKDYWYAGKAEISSYKLEQERYGQMRDGSAVLIFVTEDFLPEKQVKADNYSKDNVPVLKLNATKNFNTGVYPYSIMQSTFYPVSNNKHAIKVSASIQEWCGHVYTQLNNRDDYEIMSHSYFQSDADQNFNIKKAILENELWAKLRVNPKSLPTGNIKVIPSLEYLRLRHGKFVAQKATAKLTENSYQLYYPQLKRTLTINFNSEFPYDILSWEESAPSGFRPNAKILTTKATKIKTLKSAYWGKKSKADENLRETLGLE